MLTGQDLAEYLGEIREQVCSRCPERPPGGTPCAPLGKDCGIELSSAEERAAPFKKLEELPEEASRTCCGHSAEPALVSP
jgi:hypothetical protein